VNRLLTEGWRQMKNIRTDTPQDQPDGPEHDSCAIYMCARKHGQSTFGTLKRSLGALVNMGHRTGFVNGEGDGAGVQTDIPRRLWAKKLSQAGLPAYLATQPGFWIGHLFIPGDQNPADFRNDVSSKMNQAGLNLLYVQPGRVRKEALGQNARINPPGFWQVAGYLEDPFLEKKLLAVQIEIEKDYPIQFSSLSSHSVVYKMRGSVEALSNYYPDLQDHEYDTSLVLCHARYSTNTVSTFERAQPFAILGHNGEINTINRLRIEAKQIGANLPRDGSDSQDLDRVLHTLCVDYGLDLIEAMEMVFPPVPYEVGLFPSDLRGAYENIRQSFGPYAQGPAGIIARFGNSIVASVDALGLRPLWFTETEKEYVFSSERGAIPLENMIGDARALAPGEKMAILYHRGENPIVLDHAQIRQHVMIQKYQREAPQMAHQYWTSNRTVKSTIQQPGIVFQPQASEISVPETSIQSPQISTDPSPFNIPWVNQPNSSIDKVALVANGWLSDQISEVKSLAGNDPEDLISSLGYDGPLAALSALRVNLADYFKESVAVVTNPAIDYTRESEAFSTSSLVGACAPIGKASDQADRLITLEVPVLLGGHLPESLQEVEREVSHSFGTMCIEELMETFGNQLAILNLGVNPGETIQQAMDRLVTEAIRLVIGSVQCLVLDDTEVMNGMMNWLDPHLAISRIDTSLRQVEPSVHGNLRRRTGLIVRSAAIRTLHDIAFICGLGADAVNPYAMISVALDADKQSVDIEQVRFKLTQMTANIQTGLKKIISTMGCHELRGYGRVCSSIGLAPSVSQVFNCANYFGSESAGVTWDYLNSDSLIRGKEIREGQTSQKLQYQKRFYPKFWKTALAYANSEVGYGELKKVYRTLSQEGPVSLRHLVGIRHITDVISPSEVDITIQDYNLPVVIDAMSFGSQGEASFRSYIQAAAALNIICINGEGGELPDLIGKYNHHRGQQVASGRFGVNAEFLNSAAILEIKIGQGAKPGEGGMLPGYKVSPMVAQARKTPPYVTLLSPSNNHDLYSIEDLAQLIEELHMVSPNSRISVKIPVVPGIGVIAVGIAKAGADIINICGYDGGTGAARKHSLQYVGLPTEIGIIQAHRALVEAGIRHRVELWANGGMKTGEDVVKMVLLGANRVGFATMAMVALGCTVCRQCNRGNCHVGIATQIQSQQEADEKGIKLYHPLDSKTDYLRIVRMFKGIGDEIREITAQLGARSLQSLVGRADLLEQVQLQEKIDLSAMFEPVLMHARPALEPGVGILLIRPRNSLTTILTELILQTIADNEREVTYQDSVSAIDRALGSRLAGALVNQPELLDQIDTLHLRFGPSSLAGNGFAAWMTDKIDLLIEGGAQDGVAKGANGGKVAVMKGLNHVGLRIDGSVGKSFAYGAQNGILIVQGNADARACVRLSGAKVLFGGEITSPIDDSNGSIGMNANIKGFACEYMTSGTVLIMGDPGPYAFSGMTGGTVYQKLTPGYGFDLATLKNRLAQGANIRIEIVEIPDYAVIQELLRHYIEALEKTYQYETADQIRLLSESQVIAEQFVRITPVNQ
jgi:glutamate synthase (NADPH) large chain